MYNLSDLEFELNEALSESQKEYILTLREQLWITGSQYIQVIDLDTVLLDDFYYVGVEYFVVKGKASFYKGRIVVAPKEKLMEYLIRVIRLDDTRSILSFQNISKICCYAWMMRAV